MLKVMRQKNVTKMVLWGILILILPAFVLWGTGSIGRPKEKGPTYAGMIDNRKVSFEDFAGSVTAIRCQIILNYFNQPKVLQTFLGSKPFIGKMAWDRLLMMKETRKYGIKASDADVVKLIRSHPIFLRSGAFDPKVYEYVLRYNIGLEPRTFEEMMRQNLELQRLNDMLTKDVKISDEEIVQSYRKDNEKFKLIFAIFSADNFMDKVKIEESDIKDYYEKHKEEFAMPPKEGEETAPPKVASFDEVKDNIKRSLSEAQARSLAIKYAGEEYP
jgi:peptidyl-prolyl cis-trans isomerase D